MKTKKIIPLTRHQPSTTNNPPSPMKIHSFTCLARLINRVIRNGSAPDLSYDDVFDAAAEGRLIELLAEHYGHLTNFTFVTEAYCDSLEQMAAALRDAASAYEGRVGRASGPLSGLCLVMDIILEAIQQKFHRSPRPSLLRHSLQFLKHLLFPRPCYPI